MSLIYYNSVDILHSTSTLALQKYITQCPSLDNFKKVFNFFAANMAFCDRSGAIKIPINMQILDFCKLPAINSVNYNYEELCLERAKQLFDRAKKGNKKIAVLYSGGIDSTLILVSFFKILTAAEIQEYITVLLSEESILENPSFYKKHLIGLVKDIRPSYIFRHLIGTNRYILVTGEGNDQLFGSAIIRKLILSKDESVMHAKMSKKLLVSQLKLDLKDDPFTERLAEILWKNKEAAPIEISTVFEFYWWLNFSCKWQSVYMRVLAYLDEDSQKNLKLEENYTAFFTTSEMQIWAMKNHHHLIGKKWKNYKQLCKEIIFKFNDDRDYLDNKLKLGSLVNIIKNKPSATYITDEINYYYSSIPNEYFNNTNDFV